MVGAGIGATAKGVIVIIPGVIVGLVWMLATALVMTDFNGLLYLILWLALLGIALWLTVGCARALAARADAAEDTSRKESPGISDEPS